MIDMTTAKHTPGPWLVAREDARRFRVTNEAGDLPSNDESILNARLIAASPELLEALQRALDELVGGREAKDRDGAIQQSRAAIAKAKGEKA
jgi:hypothetical protein